MPGSACRLGTLTLLLSAYATPLRALAAPTLNAPALSPRLGALPGLPLALPLPGGARPMPPMQRPLLPTFPMSPLTTFEKLISPPWVLAILASSLAWAQYPL